MSGLAGFRILLGKELRESVRTRRLPILLVLFAVVGIISPLTGRYMGDILKATLGDQLPLTLPDPSAADALAQMAKNLGQLGVLAAIALAMGAVAGEVDRGTAALVLAQPAGRAAFIGAKAVAIGLVLLAATALATGLGWAYTTVLFGSQPAWGWVAFGLAEWLALLAWASLTLLASAATGSTTASAGVGFTAWIGLSLLAIAPALDHVLPTGLGAPALAWGQGLTSGAGVEFAGTAIVGTIALTVAALAATVVVFRRREL